MKRFPVLLLSLLLLHLKCGTASDSTPIELFAEGSNLPLIPVDRVIGDSSPWSFVKDNVLLAPSSEAPLSDIFAPAIKAMWEKSIRSVNPFAYGYEETSGIDPRVAMLGHDGSISDENMQKIVDAKRSSAWQSGVDDFYHFVYIVRGLVGGKVHYFPVGYMGARKYEGAWSVHAFAVLSKESLESYLSEAYGQDIQITSKIADVHIPSEIISTVKAWTQLASESPQKIYLCCVNDNFAALYLYISQGFVPCDDREPQKSVAFKGKEVRKEKVKGIIANPPEERTSSLSCKSPISDCCSYCLHMVYTPSSVLSTAQGA